MLSINRITYVYHTDGRSLCTVTERRCLSLVISSNLKHSNDVQHVVKKANFQLWYLRRKFCHARCTMKLTLCMTLIRPIFDYILTLK